MEVGTPITRRGPGPGSGQDQPAPLGIIVKTKIERGDRYSAPEVYNIEITFLEIIRGQDAWARMSTQGVVNQPTEKGFEYLLIRVKFGYFSKGRGFGHEKEPYIVESDYFLAFTADGQTQFPLPVLNHQLEPSLVGTPFKVGDIAEGWLVLQVSETEENPLIMFKRDYRENTYGMWAPVWFRCW